MVCVVLFFQGGTSEPSMGVKQLTEGVAALSITPQGDQGGDVEQLTEGVAALSLAQNTPERPTKKRAATTPPHTGREVF